MEMAIVSCISNNCDNSAYNL